MKKRRSLLPSILVLTLVGRFCPSNHGWIRFLVVDAAAAASGSSSAVFDKVPSSDSKQRDLSKSKSVVSSALASSSSSIQKKHESAMTTTEILAKAGKRALGGGVPGALAGVIQVVTIMWLRTVVNYQCRYGSTFHQALLALYRDGGIPRFYRGISFALIQAPLSRFGSTAANDGTEALLASLPATAHWGPGRTTLVASFVVGLWRFFLLPIDTCKTVLQVDSVAGFQSLTQKVYTGHIGVLYQGAFAIAMSAIVSHYPWFLTYNMLAKCRLLTTSLPSKVLRNSFIGFISSVVSDTVTNPIKVIKTTKQAISAKQHPVGYVEVVETILSEGGLIGLFTRGLKTRIFANALQSIIFTVIWRGLAEQWNSSKAK